MSYVQRINPFHGTLCVPYYHIWITVIISWISTILYTSFLALINKYIRYYWQSSTKSLLQTLNQQSQNQTRLQLQKVNISKNESVEIALPAEITTIIMEMIGDSIDENSSIYKSAFDNVIFKSKIIYYLISMYPIIRFIVNFINFINIMIRYGQWYNDNLFIPHWDKYCAFVITLFYMPNWRGHGANQFFTHIIDDYIVKVNHITIVNYQIFVILQMVVPTTYLVMFVIISFPIFIGGIFAYITTSILMLILFTICMGTMFKLVRCVIRKLGLRMKYDSGETLDFLVGIMSAVTFFGMWFCIMIIVCTMELYSGQNNWVNAYRIGWLGQYCDKQDYFTIENWNEYHWDIRLLVISWFLF